MFMERYNPDAANFTKNPDKYVKFSVQDVTRLIMEDLFEAKEKDSVAALRRVVQRTLCARSLRLHPQMASCYGCFSKAAHQMLSPSVVLPEHCAADLLERPAIERTTCLQSMLEQLQYRWGIAQANGSLLQRGVA